MRRTARSRCGDGRGFTLLEILLSVAILSVVAGLTYLTFSTVARAWKKGTQLADDLHHADFAMEQLVLGLRSAYYRAGEDAAAAECGFWHEDNGDGADSSDMISWVKLGTALVGEASPLAGSPHRVMFRVEEDDENRWAARLKAWRLIGQPEDFKHEDLEWTSVSRRVLGFNCRAAKAPREEEIEWDEEWAETNKLPAYVELTLYMEPLEEGEEAVELKRVVSIPMVTQSPW